MISGSLGLDFLNTLATPVDTQVDWIDDGDGLLAWLEQARLVPAKDLKALKARAMPGEFDAVAAQARSLREWFRVFVKARSGRSICPDDLRELEPLNRLLVRDEQFALDRAHGLENAPIPDSARHQIALDHGAARACELMLIVLYLSGIDEG